MTSFLDIHAKIKYSFFYFQVVGQTKSVFIYIYNFLFLKEDMHYSKKSRAFGMRYTLNLAFDGF